MRKIDLMYTFFGIDPQCRRCKDCPCLVRVTPTSRAYYKRSVYGESSAESSDWAGKWMACGRFGQSLAPGENTVLYQAKGSARKPTEEQIPGQIKMEV